MKRIWCWLSKIFWEICKGCALMDCADEEIRKEILNSKIKEEKNKK